MITKTLRLPESLAGAIREVGDTEHIEEASAIPSLQSDRSRLARGTSSNLLMETNRDIPPDSI